MEVPNHEQSFVLMDANTRTGRRRGGGPGNEHCGVLGAYGRDTRHDNGEILSAFASNQDFSLVNTVFNIPQNDISHTFSGAGNRKRIDYILTIQCERNLVQHVVADPQQSFLPVSGHNCGKRSAAQQPKKSWL